VRWDIVKASRPGIAIAGLASGVIARALPLDVPQDLLPLLHGLRRLPDHLRARSRRPGTGCPEPSARRRSVARSAALGARGRGRRDALGAVHDVLQRGFHQAIATSAAISFVVSVAARSGSWARASARRASAEQHRLRLRARLHRDLAHQHLPRALGARAAHRMPVAKLKKMFAFFLLVLAAKLAYSL
jgi:hypothetical protein